MGTLVPKGFVLDFSLKKNCELMWCKVGECGNIKP